MTTWLSKTHLLKRITLFAVVLLVSLGLCGANFALFTRYGYISGPNDPTRSAGLSVFLMATGACELIGIFVGLLGLVISALLLLGVWIYNTFSSQSKDTD